MIESADLHKYLPTLAFAVDLESTRIKGQRRVPRLHRDGSQQLQGTRAQRVPPRTTTAQFRGDVDISTPSRRTG